MTEKQIYTFVIQILMQHRHNYVAGASTFDKHGEGVFEFADRAKRKYNQITEVIEFFQGKLDRLNLLNDISPYDIKAMSKIVNDRS